MRCIPPVQTKGARHAGSNNCSTFLNIRFSPRAPRFRNAPPDLKKTPKRCAPRVATFFVLFVCLFCQLGLKKLRSWIFPFQNIFFCFSNCHSVDSSLNPFSDGDLTQLKKCNTCRTVQTSWKVVNGGDNAWRIGVAHESKSWVLFIYFFPSAHSEREERGLHCGFSPPSPHANFQTSCPWPWTWKLKKGRDFSFPLSRNKCALCTRKLDFIR